MTPLHNTRLRWLGPLGLFLFGSAFFRLTFWLEASPRAMVHSLLVGLSAGYLFWNLARWVIQRVQRRFPGLERTQTRLLWMLLFALVAVNGAVFFRFSLHILLGSRETLWLGLVDYVTSAGIQLFYYGVYVGIYEGGYLLRQWRQTYQEKEDLVKIHWQTRFDSLKAQVNPHFLFNSLNTLSALVDENPRLASAFVDEMSSVYRYLLRSNQAELLPLRAELSFIQSYFHLLKTRHGTGISLFIEVSEAAQQTLIPPLTLQLLVENAVKHNRILPEEPLTIELKTTDEGQLLVRNSLQRREQRALSNQVGLANILNKYALLRQPAPFIADDGLTFSVYLPLIQSEVNSGKIPV